MPVSVAYAFSLDNMTDLEQNGRKTEFDQYSALTRDAHESRNSQGICHVLAYQWVKKRLEDPEADLSGWLNSRRVIDEAIRVQNLHEEGPDSAVGSGTTRTRKGLSSRPPSTCSASFRARRF